MRVLFFGDVVGSPGRTALTAALARWRVEYQPDIVIANGENAAGGMGITPKVATELFAAGVDVLTLGNHTFKHKEVVTLLETEPRVVRPANYPPGVPGRGYGIFPAGESRLAVVNVLGRIFMDPLDDPFRCVKNLIPLLREQTRCILIDIHAEATSEKAAPCGSMQFTTHVGPGTSIGPLRIFPPPAVTRATAASRASTLK